MKIRIIIPCFNEEAILTQSYQHITKILDNDSRKNNYEYNLLFVDDGSSDRTIELIKKQAEKDKRVEYISLSKNFGKESAMFAGLTHSQIYDAVIIIDCDLQHPPELIPKMIEKFKNGADQVIAKRDRSGEKIIRKLYTKLYYKVINKL
ncbi:glycosyltransferase family 2 protein, partial [Mammaliicoccus lentus]